MKRQRIIATIAFTVALALAGVEVFLLFFAKDDYDYRTAREQSETISVELGLISSSFTSGNKALYSEGLSRFDQTLSVYRTNDYMRIRRADVLQSLEQYRSALSRDAEKIDTLLELRAALTAVSSELHNLDNAKIDATSFYRVSHALEDLSLALEKITLEEFSQIREVLDGFAKDAHAIVDTAATCIGVCPESVFDEKIDELNGLRERYGEQFESLGLDFSKDLNVSALINTLRGI